MTQILDHPGLLQSSVLPGPPVGAHDQQQHEAQQAAENPPVPQGEEAQGGRARGKTPAQERWSFSPPASWSPPVRKRPLTRGRTKQREEDRARVWEQGSRVRHQREGGEISNNCYMF